MVYAVYRPFAYRAGVKQLASARAELDEAEPGWRLEELTASHAARLPPTEQNSFTLVARFPRSEPEAEGPDPDDPGERSARVMRSIETQLFIQALPWSVGPKPPSANVRWFVDRFARDIPHTHPVVAELARSPVGGVPMVGEFRFGPFRPPASPAWADIDAVSLAALQLELAGASAAARRDAAAVEVYARAALNAGRAVGGMPRLHAQFIRKGCAVRAARVAMRALAWGEPDRGLDALQDELLAEAGVEWVAAALRGERAALDRTIEHLAPAEEGQLLFAIQREMRQGRGTAEERAVAYLARPYRAGCHAEALRDISAAAAACEAPTHERVARLRQLGRDERSRPDTVFHRQWRLALTVSAYTSAVGDCADRAHLRAAAAALACERFRRARGRWPGALEELVPAFLAAVPADPFDGRPLRYRRLDDGAVLYSLGADGRDDGGQIGEPLPGRWPDLGFRLWDPSARGVTPPVEDP